MKLTLSSRSWAAVLLAASAAFIAYGQSDLDPQSRARLPYLKKSDLDAKSQKSLEPFVEILQFQKLLFRRYGQMEKRTAQIGDLTGFVNLIEQFDERIRARNCRQIENRFPKLLNLAR